MGKKKKKNVTIDLKGKGLVRYFTDSLDKHGELKGKSKAETKLLKDTCPHHKLNKKGKLRSRVDVIDGVAHCTMCDHEFTTKPFSNEEINERIDNFVEVVDQTEFIAAALGVDDDTLKRIATAKPDARFIKKASNKCTKLVAKQDKIRNKEKKNDKSSSALGGWNVRR